MARLFTSGAEIHAGANLIANAADGDGITGGGFSTPTRDTAVKYSGDASWKCDSTGNVQTFQKWMIETADRALNRNYYIRMRRRFSVAAIASTTPIFTIRGSDGTPDRTTIRLQTDGTLRMFNGGTGIGTATPALSADTWYVMLVRFLFDTGSIDQFELRLYDATGETQLHSTSASGQGLSESVPEECWAGFYGNPGGNYQTWIDDFAWNDDQGANENSWPNPTARIMCLRPVSDAQVGSWTGGAGGTSNLFDAVDNTPPAGLSDVGATNTSQIESSDSSGDNSTDEYRANLRTYAAAGLTAGDTITVLHPVIEHGENTDAGTKTGSFGLQVNPAQTYATFTYGDDVNGISTWPGNWRWKKATPIYNPSVTLGDSPVMGVRKTDAGTDFVSVDAMALYVEYIPGEAPPAEAYTIQAPIIISG